MKINYSWNNFPNIGYIQSELSEDLLKPVKDEIFEIQNNFDNYEDQKYNSKLAGNIRREYEIIKSKSHLQDIILPYVHAFNKEYEILSHLETNSTSRPIILDKTWVNFQKKYEFNPFHLHSGFLSFVIWINVPYELDEELKLSPGESSRYNAAGGFHFLYPSTTMGLMDTHISIDKKMENKIIVFPSTFFHAVYPFYSSDGYRISVSGNFIFDTN